MNIAAVQRVQHVLNFLERSSAQVPGHVSNIINFKCHYPVVDSRQACTCVLHPHAGLGTAILGTLARAIAGTVTRRNALPKAATKEHSHSFIHLLVKHPWPFECIGEMSVTPLRLQVKSPKFSNNSVRKGVDKMAG